MQVVHVDWAPVLVEQSIIELGLAQKETTGRAEVCSFLLLSIGCYHGTFSSHSQLTSYFLDKAEPQLPASPCSRTAKDRRRVVTGEGLAVIASGAGTDKSNLEDNMKASAKEK